ncbi:hypothetical protein HZH66_005176 [Vespula vulgaris]|uniref:Uncharacterized protein n=1 Tax=Vespula vulgaris TaxID=7454 RepID=A0A834K9F2_VESVU|nr:hypothetical protein HZH66_005176 [Vespula vulgaris]
MQYANERPLSRPGYISSSRWHVHDPPFAQTDTTERYIPVPIPFPDSKRRGSDRMIYSAHSPGPATMKRQTPREKSKRRKWNNGFTSTTYFQGAGASGNKQSQEILPTKVSQPADSLTLLQDADWACNRIREAMPHCGGTPSSSFSSSSQPPTPPPTSFIPTLLLLNVDIVVENVAEKPRCFGNDAWKIFAVMLYET